MMRSVANESVVIVGLTPAEIDYLGKHVSHSARDGRTFVTFLSQAQKVADYLERFRRRQRCSHKEN